VAAGQTSGCCTDKKNVYKSIANWKNM